MKEQDTAVYAFGDFILDRPKAAIYKDSHRITMGRRSYDMLCYFTANPAKVISKSELLAAVWPEVQVVDNNVDRQISNLRKLLGKTSDQLDYIETVHGDGYRFVANVTLVTKVEPLQAPELAISHADDAPKGSEKQLSRLTFRLVLALSLAVVICAAFVSWHILQRSEDAANVKAHVSYQAGIDSFNSGNPLAAKVLLERELSAHPGFYPAHAALSSALLNLGYERQGRAEAQIALDHASSLSREQALFARAQYFESVSDWPQAAKSFETLYNFVPEVIEWRLRCALAFSKSGRQADAFELIRGLKSLQKLSAFNLRIELVEASIAESANDYAREYRVAHAMEIEAASKASTYQIGQAKLLQAWALDNLSRFSEAESEAEGASVLLSKLGAIGGEGRAWKLLGDIYIDQSRLEKARAAYQQAISLFRKIGYESGESVGLNNAGYVLKELGDLPGSRALFLQSLSISRRNGDMKRQAVALNGTAIVLKLMNNLSGAIEAYSAALEIHTRLNDEAGAATVLNNLAAAFMDRSNLADAEKNFQQAALLFTKLERRSDTAMAFGNLGNLEVLQGDLPKAAHYYQAQMALGKTIPDPKQFAEGLLEMGELLLLRCDFSKDRQYLHQALGIFSSLHEDGNKAEVMLALAELDLEEGNFESARRTSEEAAAAFSTQRQPGLNAVALSFLAQSLAGQHDKEGARAAAESAIRLFNGLDDKASEVTAKLHLWKVLDAIGEHGKAMNMLESVHSDALTFKFIPTILESGFYIAQLGAESGNQAARHQLSQIFEEATQRGFVLLARKLASAPHPHRN